MKQIKFFYIVFLLTAGLLSCRSSAPVSASAAEAETETYSSVWKISKNGNTMYLGGSIHVLRESDLPLPEEFNRAFSLSDILVLETDVEQMENQEIAQYLISQMFLPGEETLQTILNESTYKMLSQVCDEYGLSVIDAAKLKPSMVINILTMLQIQKCGFIQQGVDDFFLGKAKDENKPVNFLESIESQIDIIVTMGDGYENEYVSYSLQDMAETEECLEILVSDWKNGEASAMEESLTDMKDNWPVLYKTFITNRHDAWMPQLEEFIASKQVYFVITGVLHMHGSDGLLRRLENSGYSVEKLKI